MALTRSMVGERLKIPDAPPTRAPVALVAGPGPRLEAEIQRVLHARLRVAAAVLAAGFAVFLGQLFLAAQEPGSAFATQDVLFHALVVVLATLLAGLLWSQGEVPLPQLRGIELVLFGLTAAFFGWLQVAWFRHDLSLRTAAGFQLLQLAADSATLRWFALLLLYGVFIPNTWQRCGLIVATGAVIPVLLALWIGFLDGTSPHLRSVAGEMGVWLALAAGAAVFAANRIGKLRTQAFEARQFGQYRLLEKLGGGGMGEVFLAEHRLLRRPCAIKLIHPEQAGDVRQLERFEREVQATATLTSLHVVEIYDYGHAEDGTFYYVMEYLAGLSLQQLVEKHGPLPPERAIHVLRQMCKALQEAHGIGLIHRDIKPGNVIACQRGGVFDVIKLLDFGLVQAVSYGSGMQRLTQEGTITGSPQYLSPEQARGQQQVDPRSDIYSLGAVAYFLLTGRPPFVCDTSIQTLMAHVYEPLTPCLEVRPDLPPDLAAAVQRCLAKDPGERFATIASADDVLAACQCAGEWTEARSAAWWRQHESQNSTTLSLGQTIQSGQVTVETT